MYRRSLNPPDASGTRQELFSCQPSSPDNPQIGVSWDQLFCSIQPTGKGHGKCVLLISGTAHHGSVLDHKLLSHVRYVHISISVSFQKRRISTDSRLWILPKTSKSHADLRKKTIQNGRKRSSSLFVLRKFSKTYRLLPWKGQFSINKLIYTVRAETLVYITRSQSWVHIVTELLRGHFKIVLMGSVLHAVASLHPRTTWSIVVLLAVIVHHTLLIRSPALSLLLMIVCTRVQVLKFRGAVYA